MGKSTLLAKHFDCRGHVKDPSIHTKADGSVCRSAAARDSLVQSKEVPIFKSELRPDQACELSE